MEKIINVNLYGGKGLFGGKESPLVADLISCSSYEKCSFYKNGQCLRVRGFGRSERCKGSVSSVKGYTSRARKYYEFKSKYEKMDCYHKLKNAELYVAKIENEWYIKNEYLTRTKEGILKLETSLWTTNYIKLSEDEFNPSLIKRISKFVPRTILDNKEIKSYQEKTVTPFLRSLKNNFPEKFEELIKEYPEFDKSYTNVGRKAKVKSIRNNVVIKCNKDSFEVNSGFLINKSGSNTMFIKLFDKYASELEIEIKIKITDDMVVEITDDVQVDEKTIFVE